jgi:hypothetical protein
MFNERQQHAHSSVGQRGDVRNWRDTNIFIALLRLPEYRFQMLLKETNLKHNAGLCVYIYNNFYVAIKFT